MKVAEVKTFLKCPKIFRIALQTKKLQRFENCGGAPTPLVYFLGARLLGPPEPDLLAIFCKRTGLNSCSLVKKAGSEIPRSSEKIRKNHRGGGCTNPPLVNGGLLAIISAQ